MADDGSGQDISIPSFLMFKRDADLVKVEQLVQQAHVPVGGAARTNMAQHLRMLARQVFGAYRRDRAGAHFSDRRGVDDGHR